MAAAADWLKALDDGFYRTEKTSTRTVNDPMALGIKGISHSSSTLNTDAINYVKKLGYNTGAHWTKYISPTISIDSIIGIKYVLEDREKNNGLKLIHEENGIYIYENSTRCRYAILSTRATSAMTRPSKILLSSRTR